MRIINDWLMKEIMHDSTSKCYVKKWKMRKGQLKVERDSRQRSFGFSSSTSRLSWQGKKIADLINLEVPRLSLYRGKIFHARNPAFSRWEKADATKKEPFCKKTVREKFLESAEHLCTQPSHTFNLKTGNSTHKKVG